MAALLQVERLDRFFGGLRAVDGASFEVEAGSIAGLIGPNGAGKTTCFNCVAGFMQPSGGRVRFGGDDITGMAPHRVFRRGLVRTFQIPQELATMTVLENLMLTGARQFGERPWENWIRPWRVREEEQALEQRAHEVLELVQLESHAYQLAGVLSGGQRKLLELARALMTQPRMILLDEPAAGVNPALLVRISEDIRNFREQFGITFLIIEHNLDFVRELCHPVVVMAQGKVLDIGAADDVLANPEVEVAYLRGARP